MNSPQRDTVKCGGVKTLTSLPHIYAIVLMGLFTFIFLSVEYMFVNELSLLVSEQKATLSQNYVLGVSTAGFLLYPLLKHFLSRRLQNILMILAGLLSVFFTILITCSKSFEYIFHGGIILFILLGLVGSNVYNYSGALPAKASIKLNVGKAYAGQTLYYSQLLDDGTIISMMSAVVDNDGYMTVEQDHCSTYLITKQKLTNNKLETPKTADNSNIALWLTLLIVLCSSATLYTFAVKAKKMNR